LSVIERSQKWADESSQSAATVYASIVRAATKAPDFHKSFKELPGEITILG
jgi:hypothetical protein